ncbi:MAG: putative aminopeptidase YsdC [Verrucomicrobiota bacterium]|jgi:endoglucanase
MTPREFCAIARRLMTCPAAPYHEHGVRDAVEALCAEHGLDCRRDRFGNVLVELRQRPPRGTRPLALAAHLDHPGFVVRARHGRQGWAAEFLGGVPEDYFRPGIPVRLLPGGQPARLGRRLPGARRHELRPDRATPGQPPAPPRFAVWELEDFAVRGGRIHGRACDDLIGVAAILATLIELKRQRARVHVTGILARAEEVGFQGALTVAAARGVPPDSLIVSLETSRELPPVRMGRGMIVRVGDRASTFSSAATRFLAEVAAALAAEQPGFLHQRALMSGGTCEATAYQEFGYEVAAVCVALGHYHNCGPRGRIAAEFVSVADALGMVRLLTAAAGRMGDYRRLAGRLPARLRGLLAEGRRRLRPGARA